MTEIQDGVEKQMNNEKCKLVKGHSFIPQYTQGPQNSQYLGVLFS